jgi:hypothetical protein
MFQRAPTSWEPGTRTQPSHFRSNAVISAIVRCVGEVAHWNERSSLRRGVVAQGWLLRVSAHSIAHAECTLGSNREALLARLSSTVALFGFTASPLHPSPKAIAQVDATVYRCRFCHLGQSRASVQITLGKHVRSHSLDRSQQVVSGLHHTRFMPGCQRTLDERCAHRRLLQLANGKKTRTPRSWLCRYPTGAYRSCCVRR